ncbi:hypothetical protein A171_01966 [Escherichia coli KTE213]|nr:hypothetical protein A171_01966 [Escherichia coli KTE213]ELG72529.1 hypothetical protein A1YQ_03019 [Escherichia coli KTE140]
MFDIAVRPVTGIEIININRQRSQFIQTVQVILLAGIVFGQLADDRKIELINQLMTIQIQQRAAVIGNRVTCSGTVNLAT